MYIVSEFSCRICSNDAIGNILYGENRLNNSRLGKIQKPEPKTVMQFFQNDDEFVQNKFYHLSTLHALRARKRELDQVFELSQNLVRSQSSQLQAQNLSYSVMRLEEEENTIIESKSS